MRVQSVKFLVAVAAIVSTVGSKTTTSVVQNQLEFSEQLNSTTGNDESERMDLPSSVTEKVTNLSPSQQLEKAYKDLGLNQASVNPFESPSFQQWLHIADGITARSSTSVISFLAARFGDKVLMRLIKLAKTEPSTRDATVKFEKEQWSYWLASEKSFLDVFRLLDDRPMENLFDNSFFDDWSTYVKLFNTAYPDKKLSLSASLATCIGEDGVAKAIEAELKVKNSLVIAKTMQAEQFDRWIANEMSLWDVFVLLTLDRAGDKLLENPWMKTFTKFTSAINKQFRNDVKNSLVTEKWVPVAVRYAPETLLSATTDSEKALFQMWFVEKKSPPDVFKLLNLDKTGENLIGSSLLSLS